MENTWGTHPKQRNKLIIDGVKKYVNGTIEDCYNNVKLGIEVDNVIKSNKNPNYNEKLKEELNEISNMEIWQTGNIIRRMR